MTIAHTGANNVSCPFDVYYTPESSSSVEESSSSVAPSSSAGGCVCVAFVNGVGGGYGSCYNSGLEQMVSGKCYAINPDRKPVTDDWINQRATDTYWWTEVSCTNWTGCSGGGGTSSSPVASSGSVTPASSGSSGGTPATLTHGGSYYSFTAGTTYVLTCAGQQRSLICNAAGSGKTLSITYPNSSSSTWSSLNWQEINKDDHYQNAGNCTTGMTVKGSGGEIRCKNAN